MTKRDEGPFNINTSCPTRSLVSSSLIKDLWLGVPRSKINRRATSPRQRLLITEKKNFATILAEIEKKSYLVWISKLKNQSSLKYIILAIKFKAKTYTPDFYSGFLRHCIYCISSVTFSLCSTKSAKKYSRSWMYRSYEVALSDFICISSHIRFGWYSPKWVHSATW